MDKTTIGVFFIYGICSLYMFIELPLHLTIVFAVLMILSLGIGAASGAENAAYVIGFSSKMKQGEKQTFGKPLSWDVKKDDQK